MGEEMSNENNMIEKVIDSESGEIIESARQELRILVTDVDKKGNDVLKMSNFFDVCIQQLTYELSTNIAANMFEDIPISNLGIINDVIHQAEVMIGGKYGYIPDFENLPHDIKTKLDKGIYKIGESKQISGNMRAVIMDENNERIKDITLKRVMNDSDTMETTRNIFNQAQMKQIYAKLDDIQELQSYQIDRDRDRDIVRPFLNARDYILRAQNGGTLEEKNGNLKKATDELTTAINAIYTDMLTTSKRLAKLTSLPIFQKQNQIKSYIGYLTLDLQLVTRYVGVQMQVFNYLGDKVSSELVLESYQYVMQDFVTNGINAKNQSAATLIHLNYPYNETNRNGWYQFAKDMTSVLQIDQKLIEGKEIYLVSVEDVKDEREN